MPKQVNVPKKNAATRDYYTTPEFAELVGFHEQTLRYWDRTGRFKPHHKTPGGTRMYAFSQIKELEEIFAGDGIFNDSKARAKIKTPQQANEYLRKQREKITRPKNPEDDPEFPEQIQEPQDAQETLPPSEK